MATHGDIGVSQPAASTITMKVRTVTMDMNSTVAHQEVLTLGGAESSLEVARVQATAPVSTAMGLVVRIAGGPSSAADLLARVNQGIGNSTLADRWVVNTANSSAADYHGVRLVDSSGTGFHGPTNPMPFALTDSSNAVVKPADSANNAVRVNVVAGSAASTVVTVARMVGNSSAADYMPVRVVDSSGTGFLTPGLEYTDGSTTSTLAAPGLAYRNSSNDTMRVVGVTTPLPVQMVTIFPTLQSTSILVNIQTAGGSTTLVSSVAAQSHKVFAFSVTSTVLFSSCAFVSSAATEKWGLLVGSQSSGVTGANLALTPPGFLFKTTAGEALGFLASSTGAYRVSIGYFTEA